MIDAHFEAFLNSLDEEQRIQFTSLFINSKDDSYIEWLQTKRVHIKTNNDMLLEILSAITKIPTKKIVSESRKREVVMARCVIVKYCNMRLSYTLAGSGAIVRKDHSTANYILKKQHQRFMIKSALYKNNYERFIQRADEYIRQLEIS